MKTRTWIIFIVINILVLGYAFQIQDTYRMEIENPIPNSKYVEFINVDNTINCNSLAEFLELQDEDATVYYMFSGLARNVITQKYYTEVGHATYLTYKVYYGYETDEDNLLTKKIYKSKEYTTEYILFEHLGFSDILNIALICTLFISVFLFLIKPSEK